MKIRNKILEEEVESNRRLTIENSRISDVHSDGGKSFYSEVDSPDTKKLNKIIKNLHYEKNLLRT